jgi:hypothetical protein
MKTRSFQLAALITATCLLAVTACKKNNNDADAVDNAETARRMQQAAQVNMGIISNFSNALNRQQQGTPRADGSLPGTPNGTNTICPSFTLAFDTSGGWGVNMGFDFGPGCPADIALGIIRKGKLTYKYFLTNNLVSSIGVKYEQYQHDVTLYNGWLSTSYQYTAQGNNWNLTANNLQVNNPVTGNALYQSNLNYKQQQGAGTPLNANDDVYHITGTSTTTSNISGVSKFEVLTPLVNKLDCQYLVAGRVKITWGGQTGIIDYGNGACDNQATLEIGGQVFPITL